MEAEKWLYLFYEHENPSVNSYSLYRVDIRLPTATTTTSPPSPTMDSPREVFDFPMDELPQRGKKTTTSPPPPTMGSPHKIFDFPMDTFPQRGMKCARLGSKFYFLGGSHDQIFGDSGIDEIYPRKVYELDILTNEHKEIASLNSGKADSCVVFAAEGKLYALGTNPYDCLSPPPLDQFECYDPVKGYWEILDECPVSGREVIPWIGCSVLGKLHQVIVVGSCGGEVIFVYDFHRKSWERHDDVWATDGEMALSIIEGGRGNFYCPAVHRGMILKSKTSCIRSVDLMYGNPTKKVVTMSVPDVQEWPNDFFYQPYDNCANKFLLYLGLDHFCYVASGMVWELENTYTREVFITLFKELKNGDENEDENEDKKLSFEANVLDSRCHTITITPEEDVYALLAQCFIVTPELLHKKNKQERKKGKGKKKKGKKKKNI